MPAGTGYRQVDGVDVRLSREGSFLHALPPSRTRRNLTSPPSIALFPGPTFQVGVAQCSLCGGEQRLTLPSPGRGF